MKFLRFLIVCTSIVLLFGGCKKSRAPLITTYRVGMISDRSAQCGGVIYSEGDSKIIEKGLCWSSATPEPTIDQNKVICGEGAEGFSGEITGLQKNRSYFVRAYAINSTGITYGSSVLFNTLNYDPYPTVNSFTVTGVSVTSVTCVGLVQPQAGGVQITETGFCVSKNPDPTVLDNKFNSAVLSGSFSCNLLSLENNTTYYARAYATTSLGSVYGANLVFKTRYGIVVDIDGNSYYTIKVGNQEWMEKNLIVTRYNDGTAIDNIGDDVAWMATPYGAWCEYYNLPVYGQTYGKLYNWHSVNDARRLPPAGWHIPSQAEVTELLNNCGGVPVGGAALCVEGNNYWAQGGGTNSVGFSALPGGVRGTGFYYLGTVFTMWTTTPSSAVNAIMYTYGSSSAPFPEIDKHFGCSVRCVKD